LTSRPLLSAPKWPVDKIASKTVDAIRIVAREPYGSTIVDAAGEMLTEPDL